MLKKFLAGLLLAASAPVWAACGSTINPTVPAQGALIASPPIRANFAAAYSDINNLFSETYGGSAPTNPCSGQVWLNTGTTPASLQQWDGAQWVTIYTLNTSAHTSAISIGSIPLGASVNNPGTGKIEALLPPSAVTQTSYAFGTADLFKKTRRSNGGTAMTDTLPAAGATGLANGTQINIANVDASAIDTLSAGSGTTIDGNSTLVIQPGRDIWLIYDLTNTEWRGAGNSRTAVLFPGTPPTASQLWGGSSVAGNGVAWSLGTCLGLSGTTLSDTCGGTLTGPGSSTAGYLPQWNGTTGIALGAGLPVGTSGNNTVVETNGSGNIVAAPLSGALPATSNVLKGTGSAGGATAATPGTDYVVPSGNVANMGGGTAGQVPYQSAANTSGFIGPCAGGYYLEGAGAAAPVCSLAIPYVDAGGTSDAITATYSPAITTLVDGMTVSFGPTAANATTTPTFSPNGLTAHTIVKYNAMALSAGDIPGSSAQVLLQYNLGNAQWVLLNPATSGSATSANGLNSATTTVNFSSAAAPTAGQVPIASSGTAAVWGIPLRQGEIFGFTLSNDGTTPNSVLDIATGVASDSTYATMITCGNFTKSTAGSWVAGQGTNGMGTGLTVAASTWYHVFAIIKGGACDVYFDTSPTAANAPSGTTYSRYVGSFLTDSSSHILGFTQYGQTFYWNAPGSVSAGSGSATLIALKSPLGIVTFPFGSLVSSATSNSTIYLWSPAAGSTVPSNPVAYFSVNGQATSFPQLPTNTSSQLYYSQLSSVAFTIYTVGYVNPHVAPNW